MITITDMSGIRTIRADEKYAIVRSYKRPIPGVLQMQTLSPSWDLFRKYLNLRDARNWNQDTFRSIYVPAFLSEIKRSKTAQSNLVRLAEDSKHRHIALACFCNDESLCHRYIIGSLLAAAGADVNMKNKPDPEFAEMYARLA